MKSFCIKTNNQQIINYLLKRLSSITLENVYYIHRKFKIYENVIIHYKGEDELSFFNNLADILSDTILLFFEPTLLNRILTFNYFYFDDFEYKLIEKNCYDLILSDEDKKLNYRREEIWTPVLKYLFENKSMILDGFVTFRLEEYHETLDYIVDEAVNHYIIEKEYTEFINLLKMYIDSKESQTSLVHLIYTNGESILLDEKKNVISLNDYIFNAQYLSDITFSSNDYALNTLLTLLPQKIEIHLIGYEDEFIHTLKLIFGTKIFICTDCNICRTYKVLNNVR
ncbi:MAG: putative sporulation protein YtxC [Clostridia bacterium]